MLALKVFTEFLKKAFASLDLKMTTHLFKIFLCRRHLTLEPLSLQIGR